MFKKTKLLLAFGLLFSTLTNAQVNVLAHMRIPPPYQLTVEDLWKTTLENSTATTYNVYIYGVATEASLGRILVAQTKVFSLAPGMTSIMPADVSPIKIIEKNLKYADVLKFTGEMPTGEYEICL